MFWPSFCTWLLFTSKNLITLWPWKNTAHTWFNSWPMAISSRPNVSTSEFPWRSFRLVPWLSTHGAPSGMELLKGWNDFFASKKVMVEPQRQLPLFLKKKHGNFLSFHKFHVCFGYVFQKKPMILLIVWGVFTHGRLRYAPGGTEHQRRRVWRLMGWYTTVNRIVDIIFYMKKHDIHREDT